jgi:hypothetical protein
MKTQSYRIGALLALGLIAAVAAPAMADDFTVSTSGGTVTNSPPPPPPPPPPAPVTIGIRG